MELSSSSEAGGTRFREARVALVLIHANTIISKNIAPRPLLLLANVIFSSSDQPRPLLRPLAVGNGEVLGGGHAIASVGAAVAGAADCGATDIANMVLINTDADAGDEESVVGGSMGSRGVDGDVAASAQEGSVLHTEEVTRFLL